MADPNPGLQFDHAEFEGSVPAAAACVACQKPLADAYYEVGGLVTCEPCKRQVEQDWNQSSAFSARVGRLFRATLFGSLAAIAGSAIYFAVAALFKVELSLIAILVGFMVGGAVKKGAQQRGGWLYQALAVFLTYTSIVSSYMLFAFYNEGLASKITEQATSTLHLVLSFVLLIPVMYATPFLGGVENIMGIVIIAIGLYQAWSINKKVVLQITGPYTLGSQGAARGAVEPAPPPIRP
jgi:hypothetical protein